MFSEKCLILSLLWTFYLCSAQDNVSPVLTCPASVNISTTSIHATANWIITVTDNVDTDITATCDLNSGSLFTIGQTIITCLASDSAGNLGSCTFKVNVVDKGNPSVQCPGVITAETGSSNQARVVWYPPFVTDNLDNNLVAICTPVSGVSFGFGSTTVNCIATDAAGNVGSCNFRVDVIDNAPPNITCCNDIYVGKDPIIWLVDVHWTYPIVNDNIDISPETTCRRYAHHEEANQPAVLDVGTYTYACTAKDSAGNSATCTFVIAVINDSVSPTVSCPIDMHVKSSGTTVAVNWDDPVVSDNIDIALSTYCSPSSGSLFTQGLAVVQCYSTDDAANVGSCAFQVNVTFVEDHVDPTVVCPNDMSTSTTSSVATPTWDVTVTDNVDAHVVATCVPNSGSVFNIGETTVTCSATDTAGNSDSCTFKVTALFIENGGTGEDDDDGGDDGNGGDEDNREVEDNTEVKDFTEDNSENDTSSVNLNVIIGAGAGLCAFTLLVVLLIFRFYYSYKKELLKSRTATIDSIGTRTYTTPISDDTFVRYAGYEHRLPNSDGLYDSVNLRVPSTTYADNHSYVSVDDN